MELSEIDVLILAGGLGTRVSHLLEGIPKPMAEFDGKPFLEWVLLWLRKQGFRKIVLSLGYLGDEIKVYFGDGAKWGLGISYAQEEEPLNTGGAIKYSLTQISSDTFFVLNGDSITLLDYGRFLAFHFKKKADISICVVEVDNVERYGGILTDKQDRIISFKEKPAMPEKGWINAGVYLIKGEFYRGLAFNKKFSFEYDVLANLPTNNIYAFRYQGRFLDIGVPRAFKEGNDFIAHFKDRVLKI